jgi:hypothetical protein
VTKKPIVMYAAARGQPSVGSAACVQAVCHPTQGTQWVNTSWVQSVDGFFTAIGPKFETRNTLYIPLDWLDEGALGVHCEQPEPVG